MFHGGDDGLWGPEAVTRTSRVEDLEGLQGIQYSNRKRAGGQVAELQISPCLQRLPVRRPMAG